MEFGLRLHFASYRDFLALFLVFCVLAVCGVLFLAWVVGGCGVCGGCGVFLLFGGSFFEI